MHTHAGPLPAGTHSDFPVVDREEHLLERPLLAVTGGEQIQQ